VREPFKRLIEGHALLSYKYTGFWQCMDTFKDKSTPRGAKPGGGALEVWNHVGSPNSNVPELVTAGI